MSTVWCGKTVWGSRPFRPSSELRSLRPSSELRSLLLLGRSLRKLGNLGRFLRKLGNLACSLRKLGNLARSLRTSSELRSTPPSFIPFVNSGTSGISVVTFALPGHPARKEEGRNLCPEEREFLRTGDGVHPENIVLAGGRLQGRKHLFHKGRIIVLYQALVVDGQFCSSPGALSDPGYGPVHTLMDISLHTRVEGSDSPGHLHFLRDDRAKRRSRTFPRFPKGNEREGEYPSLWRRIRPRVAPDS